MVHDNYKYLSITVFFFVALESRTRTNGLKLHQGKFSLNVRKSFLTVQSVRPGKIVDSLSIIGGLLMYSRGWLAV